MQVANFILFLAVLGSYQNSQYNRPNRGGFTPNYNNQPSFGTNSQQQYPMRDKPQFGRNSQSQYPVNNGGRPGSRPDRFANQQSDPYANQQSDPYADQPSDPMPMDGAFQKITDENEIEAAWETCLPELEPKLQSKFDRMGEPISMEKQVVNGVNMKFYFEDKSTVTFYQPPGGKPQMDTYEFASGRGSKPGYQPHSRNPSDFNNCRSCVNGNFAWAAERCVSDCYQIQDVACADSLEICESMEEAAAEAPRCQRANDCSACIDAGDSCAWDPKNGQCFSAAGSMYPRQDLVFEQRGCAPSGRPGKPERPGRERPVRPSPGRPGRPERPIPNRPIPGRPNQSGMPGQPQACCKALTAQCMSCSKGMSLDAYCAENPATYGCPRAGGMMNDHSMNGGYNGGMSNADMYNGGNNGGMYNGGMNNQDPYNGGMYNGGGNNGGMMAGGWSKSSMSVREMEEKWDAVLGEQSNRDLVQSENLAQLDEPVSVETQVVRGTNYHFEFEDGTIVTVLEVTWENRLEITDIKRAAGSKSQRKHLRNIHQSMENNAPTRIFSRDSLIAAAIGGSIAGVIFGLVYSGFRESRQKVDDDMYIDLTLDAQQRNV